MEPNSDSEGWLQTQFQLGFISQINFVRTFIEKMCTDLRYGTQSLPRNIARSGVSGRAFGGPEVTAAQLSCLDYFKW